jgi:peptidoglycan/xylan/chitin deacetylase (PgdA/CDA1 family)
MLRSHDRYSYSAITRRPLFDWPDGRRLALYIALNLEHYAFGEGLTEELVPAAGQPDVLNYSWRDYGNRVAAWRLLELFGTLQLPLTLLLNTELYEYCPELIAAFREYPHQIEIAAHGRTNSEQQNTLDEAAERRFIDAVTQTITRHEGRPPAGWLGPWIAETERTPDLLQEAGYSYTLDWCADDQPVWLSTRNGKLLAVPYPQELNDSATIVCRRAGAAEFADMIIDQFDEMLVQSHTQPLVMGIALHSYIIGQPFRLRQLRRALQHISAARAQIWPTTAGAIARHFAGISR